MLNLVRLDKEYTKVPLAVFEALGWDIPDNGKTVKALADEAYRGAVAPELVAGRFAVPAEHYRRHFLGLHMQPA